MLQVYHQWTLDGCPSCASEDVIVYGQGETVLLAETDNTLLILGAALLEKLGYRALTARTADELMRHRCASRLDLMILDVELLKQSGPEFMTELRERQPAIGILRSSVHQTMTFGHAGCGAGDFLFKPYSVSSFSQAVGQILRRRACQGLHR